MVGEESAACSICGGSGWIAIEGSLRATSCTCQSSTRKQQRITAARIPSRYIHCRLGTFHDRGNTTLALARRRVQEFTDCWPVTDRQRGILLMGGCGLGKTHLAVALLQELIGASKPGKLLFSNFQDLIQEIHASFDSDETPSKSEILRPLLDADLLVLDELGSQKPTLFVQDVLYYIINSRYNDERVTIFTTNYVDDPREREESLEERIGKRLRSRLYEMTERVVLGGADDYRKSATRVI